MLPRSTSQSEKQELRLLLQVASRYHLKVIRDWRNANQIVKIIPKEKSPTRLDDNNNVTSEDVWLDQAQPNNEIKGTKRVRSQGSRVEPTPFEPEYLSGATSMDQDDVFPSATCKQCAGTKAARRIWFPLDHRQSYRVNQPCSSKHQHGARSASLTCDAIYQPQPGTFRFHGAMDSSSFTPRARVSSDQQGRFQYSRVSSPQVPDTSTPIRGQSHGRSLPLRQVKETYV